MTRTPEVAGPEEYGPLVGGLTGRELEIVVYAAGLGVIIGLAVVGIGALLKFARRRTRRPRS